MIEVVGIYVWFVVGVWLLCISVVSFYQLSIAFMKNFFAALHCRYPFGMWFVEEWLRRDGIQKPAVK